MPSPCDCPSAPFPNLSSPQTCLTGKLPTQSQFSCFGFLLALGFHCLWAFGISLGILLYIPQVSNIIRVGFFPSDWFDSTQYNLSCIIAWMILIHIAAICMTSSLLKVKDYVHCVMYHIFFF